VLQNAQKATISLVHKTKNLVSLRVSGSESELKRRIQRISEVSTMGLTALEIEVGNPANPKVTEKVNFLIDSGAVYSVVPTPVLERLGIKPLAEEEFRLADGTKVVRKKGIALFKYGKRIGGADVIFGKEGDHKLLGRLPLRRLVLPSIR